MKLVKQFCFTLLLLTTSFSAHSLDLDLDFSAGSERLAVGIHLGNQTSGFSGKYRATDEITGQVTFDITGNITNVGLRGLYAFNAAPNYELYGFGALSVFRFSSGSFSSTSIGVGGGAGIEYDLRDLSPTLPALFASAELGAALGSFSDFSGFSTVGLGLALHYRF